MEQNIKHINIIVKVIWYLSILVGMVFTCYTNYLENKITQDKLFDKTISDISILDTKEKNIQKKMYDLNFKVMKEEDLISQLQQSIYTTKNYQDILRKEVQSLAENKLNISEFWRYVGNKKNI